MDSPNNRLIDRLGQKLEDLEQKVNQINMQNEQRIPRALSQPSVYQGISCNLFSKSIYNNLYNRPKL